MGVVYYCFLKDLVPWTWVANAWEGTDVGVGWGLWLRWDWDFGHIWTVHKREPVIDYLLVALWESRGSLLMLRAYIAIERRICTISSSPILLVHVDIVEIGLFIGRWGLKLLFHSILRSFHLSSFKPFLNGKTLIFQTTFNNFISNTLLFLEFLEVFWVLCLFCKFKTYALTFDKRNLYLIALFFVSDMVPYTGIAIEHVFVGSYQVTG